MSQPNLCLIEPLTVLCYAHEDEIDAIAPKRDSVQREMERRIVAQLLTCMDDLGGPLPGESADDMPREGPVDSKEPAVAALHKHVIVIGASLIVTGLLAFAWEAIGCFMATPNCSSPTYPPALTNLGSSQPQQVCRLGARRGQAPSSPVTAPRSSQPRCTGMLLSLARIHCWEWPGTCLHGIR